MSSNLNTPAPLIVVGSMNVDSFTFVTDFPRPGETILATSAVTGFGGKGLNQAMAAVRAGAETHFVGSVGDDVAGGSVIGALQDAGIDTAQIAHEPGVVTGAAFITVNAEGENIIIVASGANATVTPEAATASLEALLASNPDPILLIQGELDDAASEAVGTFAIAHSLRLITNLAPVGGLSEALLSASNPLIVNETEGADLLARWGELAATPARVAAALHRKLGTPVVITIGAAGAIVAENGEVWRQPAPRPDAVVDTTGAGDAFVGVLAAALCAGHELPAAVRRAVVAASHSVTGVGTVTSYASGEKLEELLAGAPDVLPA